MRVALKGLGCFVCFCVYFLAALLVSLLLIFFKPSVKRQVFAQMIRVFSFCLVRIMRVRVKVTGERVVAPGAFFVSNHVGYLDGMVLGSIFPAIFVSKSALKDWPLIGLMTQMSGTLYIDRVQKNQLALSVGKMAGLLRNKVNVLFFPEGTSTNGEALWPFKSAFFEAPLEAYAPIVPVSIVYHRVNGAPVSRENRDLLYWYGEMTFVDHFFRLLGCRCVDVEVKVHAPVEVSGMLGQAERRKLAAQEAYAAVLSGVRLIV